MSVPKICPDCGTAHHSHQAHVFATPARSEESDARPKNEKKVQRESESASCPDDVSAGRVSVRAEVEPEKVGVAGKGSALTQVERNRRWREKNRERYNEYQRELMRERGGK